MTSMVLPTSAQTNNIHIKNLPLKIKGTAVKHKGRMWKVFLWDDQEFSVTQSELLDPTKYEILEVAQNMSIDMKHKHQHQQT